MAFRSKRSAPAVNPPSTGRRAPFTKAASSEARIEPVYPAPMMTMSYFTATLFGAGDQAARSS